MALSITAIITLRAPQFASDPRLNDFIELAELQTSSGFGARYNFAVALRVLHVLTLEVIHNGLTSASTSGTAIAGIIASESEGDLSRSYENTSASMGAGVAGRYVNLSTTAYGTELIELINSTFFKPRTRAMS